LSGDFQSIGPLLFLATEIPSKRAWEFDELATKENAHSVIDKFLIDTFSLYILHLQYE
jgi:hypothetical protein